MMDHIDKKNLLNKEQFGFQNNKSSTDENGLEERSQCVKIGTEVSEHIFVKHRVPQGKALGPLIFLLYVNDFSEKNQR